MSLLQRGRPPGGPLPLSRIGAVVAAALVAGSCSVSTGDASVADPPQPSDAAPLWWFEGPCNSTVDPTCRPPVAAGLPAETMALEPGYTEALEVTEPGAVVVGGADRTIGAIEVRAPDVRLIGVDARAIIVNPEADGTAIEASVIGQLFVNGADGVLVRGNLIRPDDAGPDAVQVKTFDGDAPRNLRFEANVIGPQDSARDAHTDCVQILGGDGIVFARNIVLPCGDKAFQIRSGAGGTVGTVTLEGNVIYECVEQRDGCAGFHAIVWASTAESVLELRHNTILGSVGVSSGGSTADVGDNFIAIANIAVSLPCTDRVAANLTVSSEPCDDSGAQGPLPEFVDDSPTVGDVRLVDPAAVPVGPEAFGPSIDGRPVCPRPRVGAATACS